MHRGRAMKSGMRKCAVTVAIALLNLGSVAAEPARFSVDGKERTYLIERPSGQTPRPTIIMLHGFNGSGAQIARGSGLDRLAPQNGVVAIFPDKHPALQGWNFFPSGKEPPSLIERTRATGIPDDVGYLKALIADLVRRGISDQRRVYLAGLSNGSFMVLRMICSNAGLLAAAGLVVGGMPEEVGADCRPTKRTPVMMINGTDDQIVPYAGGPVQPGGLFNAWSTERLVAFFRQLNGCAGMAEQSLLANTGANKIELARSRGCAGAPVEFYRVIGGGHSLPPELTTGQLLLDFFRDKARP
jgi:polyhydroxybutyrate depolymerase